MDGYGNPFTDFYSNCGEDILGGYGKVPIMSRISREYVGLPAHNIIYFRFTLYAIDSWTDYDGITLDIDDGVIMFIFQFDASTFPSNLCGGPANDDIYTISGEVRHTESSLPFTIVADFESDPTIETFGVRNLQIKTGTKGPGPLLLTV